MLFYFAKKVLQCVKNYARVDGCSDLVRYSKIFSNISLSQDSAVVFLIHTMSV